MTERYGDYTLVHYSACCGTGGVGVENTDGLMLLFKGEGLSDMHLFPTDREAKAWVDGGAALGDEFVWERD